MGVSEKIKDAETGREFRICPSCGYEMGFHLSFLEAGDGKKHKIILICPNCGARFDIGWNLAKL
jgi:predicted RNA-binding Zn-ribbon protein involved in translation (DUF1610 family)